jgi:FkbM family methyltransferase
MQTSSADKKILVNKTTLDDYCKTHSIDHIDLMKIDVEGAEALAYEGMQEILEKNRFAIKV